MNINLILPQVPIHLNPMKMLTVLQTAPNYLMGDLKKNIV